MEKKKYKYLVTVLKVDFSDNFYALHWFKNYLYLSVYLSFEFESV